MRLYEYLERPYKDLPEAIDEISNLLLKECNQFLKEVGSSIMLYRGTEREISKSKGYDKVIPRDVRMPKDTPVEIHTVLDDEFKKKFGWRVRSQGVFATTSMDQAWNFGSYIYNFFPCNGYKYVYSDDIYDLTGHLTDEGILLVRSGKYTVSDKFPKETIDSIIRGIPHRYKDSGLKKMNVEREISFYCPNGYYIVDNDLIKEIWSKIYKK